MNALEIISQDLFDKVRSRFPNLQMGDEAGAVTLEPKDARFFDFDFVLEGNDLGRISISINEVGSLKVFYSQGILEGVDHVSAGMWYDFLKEMRQFAKRRLLRFDTRDITKGNLDKNDFQYLAQNGTQENNMNEASYYGSSMSSYRKLEDTKLILRHSKAVEEGQPGARSRHISSIFIENAEGERFKYPFIHLAGAKAMQRHVANGGNPYDPAGQAIVSMSEAINQLGRFKRHFGSNSQLNDDINTIVTRAKSKLDTLRTTVEQISKQGHYEQWMENFSPSSLPELDDVTREEYKSKFTIQQFDETLTDVFPLLHAIMQETSEIELDEYVSENAESDICPDCKEDPCVCDDEDDAKKEGFDAFASWADEVVENTPHLKNPDTPAIDRKKAGYKLSHDDVKNHTNKHKYDFYKRRTGEKHPEDTRDMDEGYYLGPEDLPEWTRDALQRVKNGEVRDWTELYSELVGDLGIDDNKADHIAKRVFGYKGVDKTLRKGPPPDEIGAPQSDDDDNDDDAFLNKMRQRVKHQGSIGQDTTDFGAEMGEETEQQPQGSIKEIAEMVKSMFDGISGKFPLGETGVVTRIRKEFGDRAGELAERLVVHLKQKHESLHQIESIRRLSGLPALTEAEKKKWIQDATKNKGGLHKALGVPAGEKIPKGKLAVKPGDSAKVKKEKTLAKTLSKLRK
jgi:hypothetical protein